MPFHALSCKGGLPCLGGLFWESEVCWWLLSRLFCRQLQSWYEAQGLTMQILRP